MASARMLTIPLVLARAAIGLKVHHASLRAAMEASHAQASLVERANGLESWRLSLVNGHLPEPLPKWPELEEAAALAPVARLTYRHPGLVGGVLRLLAVSREDRLLETARILHILDAAFQDGGIVDAVASEAMFVSGQWKRSGIEQLELLSQRLESDLIELRHVMDTLGRRTAIHHDKGPTAYASSDSTAPAGEWVDGFSTLTHHPFRASSLEKAIRRRKPSFFKLRLAASTLTGLDLAVVARGSGSELAAQEARGPLVVCLDTSHSMTGGRETLSKATVLATTRAALKQKRPVKVMAFGNTHELAEVDCRVTNAATLDRLARFLEYSFGGGTDIASPLRRAIAHIEGGVWRDADIVLVSDGELMDPPVDIETEQRLNAQRNSRGLQVTGLLAGRARPPSDPYKNARPGSPFARLCDSMYTFLADHDDLSLLIRRRARASDREEDDPFEAALCAADDRIGSGLSSPAYPCHRASLTEAVAFVERGLIDRAAEARLVVLAALAREHALFYGPPGTAKSELCRRLGLLLGGSSFELSLTRFTTLDDLFGPLSLAALDRDEYRRCATGLFAQHATVCFFDEIFRAKSALPALLGLLNERQWFDGPDKKEAALVSAIAASNSLPEEAEGAEDGALFDRFLIRTVVRPVSDDKVSELLLLQDDEEHEIPSNFAPIDTLADLPEYAVNFFCEARRRLRDMHDQPVSDRRLRKTARLVRIAAAAAGRSRVNCLDLLLARYTLWSKPNDSQVEDWLFQSVLPPIDGAFAPLVAEAAQRFEATDLDELEALVDAIAEAVVEMRSHALDLDRADHPLVAPADLARARLHLAPTARARATQLEDLLRSAVELRHAKICGGPLPPDFAVPPYDDGASTLRKDNTHRSSKSATDDDSPTQLPDDFDLSWSKKQARARLTSAEFQRWTEARRRRGLRSS